MPNKTKQQPKVANPPITQNTTVQFPLPKSINHGGAKHKVSWNILQKDKDALDDLLNELHEIETIEHSKRVSDWVDRGRKDENGKPQPRMPRRTSQDILPSVLQRICVHLGVKALKELSKNPESIKNLL
jgi:hypothetical protein